MRTICPLCNKEGYLIKEKPRKKNVTSTRRGWYKNHNKPYPTEPARGCGWSPHIDYPDTRTRGWYYKFLHKIKDTNGKWKNKLCYIGNIELQLERYKKKKTDDKGNIFTDTVRRIKQIEKMIKKEPSDLSQDDIMELYKLKSKPR